MKKFESKCITCSCTNILFIKDRGHIQYCYKCNKVYIANLINT